MALVQQEAIDVQPLIAQAKTLIGNLETAVDKVASGGIIVGGSALQQLMALGETVAQLQVKLANDIGD